MRGAVAAFLGFAFAGVATADEPRPSVPADFRVQIENFGARKEPLRRAELVVRNGRGYWLLSDSNEVAVYEPAAGQVEVLDLQSMERTDLTLKKLDDALGRWRTTKRTAIEKLKQAGGRANSLAAAMGNDLIAPGLSARFDAATNQLRMKNPSVDIDATGEPEPDTVRRAFEADALAYILKLETVRDPSGIPPFAAIEALRCLSSEHKLRPAEIMFLYRLAGPPLKVRWTYKLHASLSERERATVAKIDRARERARFVRFDRFDEE